VLTNSKYKRNEKSFDTVPLKKQDF